MKRPQKTKVREMRGDRKMNPLSAVLGGVTWANFHAMRYLGKWIARMNGGYGPSSLSPESQEHVIDFRDLFGWGPFMEEMKELVRIIGPVMGNEMAVWGSFARNFKTRHLTVTTGECEPDFWEEMEEYAGSLGVGMIGYTAVDSDYIFQGARILYPNLVVLGMEMRWPEMSQAPALPAAVETMRTYASLGRATNKVADFFMKRGYRAQPLSPYSWHLLFTAAARQAGLAEKGLHGLMITPRYGPLQRWSAVAIEAGPMPVRKPVDMDWLPDFCASCRLCIRACPGKAVLDEPIPGRGNIVTHIDNEKCEPYFGRYRGCNVCIKVCTERLREEGLISG